MCMCSIQNHQNILCKTVPPTIKLSCFLFQLLNNAIAEEGKKWDAGSQGTGEVKHLGICFVHTDRETVKMETLRTLPTGSDSETPL